MGEIDLSENDQKIMEYIIGSLDSDGLLRKDSQSICDELAIYQGVYCDVEDIDRIIGILQTFDPAGIGAHSLQECLLLQIERRPDDRMKQLMTTVVKKHFNDFAKKQMCIRDSLRCAVAHLNNVDALLRSRELLAVE